MRSVMPDQQITERSWQKVLCSKSNLVVTYVAGAAVSLYVFSALCMFDMWKQPSWRQEGLTCVCMYKAV